MRKHGILMLAGLLCAGCPSSGDGDAMSGTSPADSADDGAPTTGAGATGVVDGGEVTASTGQADGTDGESDGGQTFIIDDPDGGTGGSFGCDLFSQDCNAGEKCMPYAANGGAAWDSTRCSPVDGDPAQVGDECLVEGSGVSGVDDCDIGLMCWNVDESGIGICEDLCTGSAEAPICDNPDDTCSQANGGAIALCLPECDPLLQECDEGQACYPINDAFACAPDASGDPGAHGDACEFINACDAGTICIGADAHSACAGATGCCSSVCSVMDPNSDADCAGLDAGQSCEAWFVAGMAPPGYEDVGVCALPV